MAAPFFASLFAGDAEGAEPAHTIAYLWPCNVAAWQHWAGVQTQWRSGPGGATGLDYAGVRAYLDECGLCGDERKDIFAGLRAAEAGCLQGWDTARQVNAARQKK